MPTVKRGAHRAGALLGCKIDDGRGAAVRRRDGAGLKVIGRDGAPNIEFHMRVDINAARNHIDAARVDHAVGGHCQFIANLFDLVALDKNVGDVIIGRRDDATVFDYCGCHTTPSINRKDAKNTKNDNKTRSSFLLL